MFWFQVLDLVLLFVAAFFCVLLIWLLFGNLAKQFNVNYAGVVSYLLLQAMRIYMPIKDAAGNRYVATTEFGGSPFEFWFGLIGVAVFMLTFRWLFALMGKVKEGGFR